MLKKVLVVLLVLVFAACAFAKGEATYPNYDLAPGVVPGPTMPADEQWDLQYDWDQMEAQTGDNGLLGIAYDGTYVWVTGRGYLMDPQCYLFDPATGVLIEQFPSTATSSWGVRDMCFDGTYMYGGWESGLICWDITTHAALYTIPIPGGMSFQRGNAYDPATDHFYAGNFGSTCYEQDRNGVLIRSFAPAPLGAVYGMAWDDHPSGGGPWLWIHDQTYPSSGCNAHQMDPVTLTYTGFSQNVNPPGSASPIAGGLDYAENVVPTHTSMLSFGQGTPDAGAAWEMYVAASLGAPGAPTDFTVGDNLAALVASLDWVNPAVTVGGDPLTDLDGVRVYRNGDLIVDLTDVVIGAAYSYTDGVPSAGMYNYELMPYNDEGDGIPASAGAWIGLDVPEAPPNVNVVPDPGGGLEATVTWDDPAAGAHGGYWPAGSFDSFNIYRSPATTPLVQIATGVTGNSYIDIPPINGWYDYGVSAVNASGEGPIAEFGPVYVGPPEMAAIPYDWVEINAIGTPSGVTGDDQNLGPFDMGISFPWYENVMYSGIRICSNGFLSFTSSSTSWTNYTIPTTNEPNNLVAPMWDDLYPPGGGVIYYYQDTANNRFIVEFDHVMSYSSPRTPQTFEAIFYPDGIIDFMYNEIQAPCVNANTVGVENATGTVGVLCTYNGSGPLEPASNTGIRIYPVGIPPWYDVSIVFTPTVTTVPAGGGDLEFNAELTNNELTAIPTIDVWTMVTSPTGTVYGPLIGPVSILNWAAGGVIERDRIQSVPAVAPAGDWTYDGYLGFYPANVMGEGHFDWTKSTDGDGSAIVHGWATAGEPFPGEIMDPVSAAPSDYELLGAYPNPFNATANINYVLPERSLVTLVVYDVTGREVATLVDGYVEVGIHNAQFNGSNLSSGVYFYRLTANSFTDVKKMILIK